MAIETQTRISNEAYERLALSDTDRKWELWDGVLREKPGGTAAANSLCAELVFGLLSQLDWAVYQGRTNAGRLRRPPATYVVPDVFVFPVRYVTPRLRGDDVLEVYEQPVPLVAQMWSAIAGDAYVQANLAIFKERGDHEIWFLHPYERWLIRWVRELDGSYLETELREGLIRPVGLPGVAIDLDALFDL